MLETDDIIIRGLYIGERLVVGLSGATADATGTLTMRPLTDEHLSGHVGLVTIVSDRSSLGELELVPSKLSERAYRELRADLQRVWTDLVFDPEGLTAVQATAPSARELWRRIDDPIARILDHPNEELRLGTGVRRMDRVRRPRELQPAVVRAGLRGRPALIRTLERTTDTPENRLCQTTLELLRSHARRDPDAGDIARRIDVLLREPIFARSRRPVRSVTWGMRSDRRYRQVLAVHQVLNRPELAATEGPGDLRLGIPALTRLYEYWLFLQVLVAAAERYGPPEAPGFEALAVRLPGRRRRLELERGTTVTFPGPVHVAFEPDINTRGDGWMGIEYVPHPDLSRRQFAATPDVLVFRPGGLPWLTVIDAKYVGRSFVELEAAKLHEKYARMRWRGTSVVRKVLAAHPHEGFSRQWAGYGHVPMAPGLSGSELFLPPPVARAPVQETATREGDGLPHTEPGLGLSDSTDPGSRDRGGALTIIADQYWMYEWLQGRRIDIGILRAVVAAGRPVDHFEIVMPRLSQLITFARAAQDRGWDVEWVESPSRSSQITALLDRVSRGLQDGPVIVVSGDPAVVERLPAEAVDVFDDLTMVPLL